MSHPYRTDDTGAPLCIDCNHATARRNVYGQPQCADCQDDEATGRMAGRDLGDEDDGVLKAVERLLDWMEQA